MGNKTKDKRERCGGERARPVAYPSLRIILLSFTYCQRCLTTTDESTAECKSVTRIATRCVFRKLRDLQ